MAEYEVGYGKPPKWTRWKVGESGNPTGREQGHKGLKTDLEAALNAVTTLENKLKGGKTKGRNQQHAVNRLVERAALGDLKAAALLLPMILQVLGAEDRHTGARKLSAQDESILAAVLSSRLGEAARTFRELASPDDTGAADRTPEGQEEDKEEVGLGGFEAGDDDGAVDD